MSQRTEWSSFEINKAPVGLDAEVERKYGIPFEWGALHVTQQADKAYGFVPLTAEAVKGDGIDCTENTSLGFRTDIFLMSPEEFMDQTPENESAGGSYGDEACFGAIALHKGGIEVRLALSQGPEDMRAMMLGGIASLVEQFGGDIDDVRTQDDIPIAESLGQDASQMLVHELCSFAAHLTQDATVEFLRADTNKKALRRFTELGASGLAGAGVMLGINGVLLGEISNISVGGAVAYAGLYSYLARRSIKQHLSEASKQEQQFNKASIRYANKVANGIHEVYCTTHFDRKAEAMFGDN